MSAQINVKGARFESDRDIPGGMAIELSVTKDGAGSDRYKLLREAAARVEDGRWP